MKRFRVFISYRRQDASGEAGRLYDALSSEFGASKVFIDVAGLQPGVDFAEKINAAIGQCDAFIALIGPNWSGVTDASGKRRLPDPDDFVHRELAAALRSESTRVIPVLIRGAQMPAREELPTDIAHLTGLNATELTERRWRYDVSELTRTLSEIRDARLGRLRRALELSRRRGVVLLVGLVAVGVVVAGGLYLLKPPEEGDGSRVSRLSDPQDCDHGSCTLDLASVTLAQYKDQLQATWQTYDSWSPTEVEGDLLGPYKRGFYMDFETGTSAADDIDIILRVYSENEKLVAARNIGDRQSVKGSPLPSWTPFSQGTVESVNANTVRVSFPIGSLPLSPRFGWAAVSQSSAGNDYVPNGLGFPNFHGWRVVDLATNSE